MDLINPRTCGQIQGNDKTKVKTSTNFELPLVLGRETSSPHSTLMAQSTRDKANLLAQYMFTSELPQGSTDVLEWE